MAVLILPMSAEPILVTDRAVMPVRISKIHKEKGGAICLEPDLAPCTRAGPATTLKKPVDGFQRVDESLGISESFCDDAIMQRVSFF